VDEFDEYLNKKMMDGTVDREDVVKFLGLHGFDVDMANSVMASKNRIFGYRSADDWGSGEHMGWCDVLSVYRRCYG
jgi:hypothetical protein